MAFTASLYNFISLPLSCRIGWLLSNWRLKISPWLTVSCLKTTSHHQTRKTTTLSVRYILDAIYRIAKVKIFLIPLSITFLSPKILAFLFVGHLLDKLRKLYMNITVDGNILESFLERIYLFQMIFNIICFVLFSESQLPGCLLCPSRCIGVSKTWLQ